MENKAIAITISGYSGQRASNSQALKQKFSSWRMLRGSSHPNRLSRIDMQALNTVEQSLRPAGILASQC